MGTNPTKRQHYVPQFYLKLFTDQDSFLYCYNKNSEKKFKARAKDVCCEEHYYEVSVPNSEIYRSKFLLENDIEKRLQSDESKYKPVLIDIIHKCEKYANKPISVCTEQERITIISMVANFIIRNKLATTLKCSQEEKNYLIENNEVIGAVNTFIEYFKLGSIDPYLELAHKRISLNQKIMKGLAAKTVEDLKNMNLFFWLTDSITYVTGNCPVNYNMIGNHFNELIMPLSPNISLILSRNDSLRNKENKAFRVNEKVVLKLNSYFLKYSYSTLIIGNSSESIQQLLK